VHPLLVQFLKKFSRHNTPEEKHRALKVEMPKSLLLSLAAPLLEEKPGLA